MLLYYHLIGNLAFTPPSILQACLFWLQNDTSTSMLIQFVLHIQRSREYLIILDFVTLSGLSFITLGTRSEKVFKK